MTRTLGTALALIGWMVASMASATVVNFSGQVTGVSGSSAAAPFFANGDRFVGSFTYDPNARLVGTIGGLDYNDYSFQSLSDFRFTFTSGRSAGVVVGDAGLRPEFFQSRITLGVVPGQHLAGVQARWVRREVLPELIAESVTVRFFDSNQDMLVSSALADFDADRAFANKSSQSSEIRFVSAQNGSVHDVRFAFDFFSATSPVPSASVSEPGVGMLLAAGLVMALAGGLRHGRRSPAGGTTGALPA